MDEELFNPFDDDVDPRSFEKQFYQLDYLIADRKFTDNEELERFVDEVFQNQDKWDALAAQHKKTVEEEAQELLYDAYAESESEDRVRLAKQALQIFPNCADAYVILAENEASSEKEELKYYAKGVEVGRLMLEPKILEKNPGALWSVTKTRPFLRALSGYALTQWSLGNRQKGIDTANELLELDAEDHIGIRYMLLFHLIAAGKNNEAIRLLKRFPDEDVYAWELCKAFLMFVKQGASAKAKRTLKNAIEMNPYIGAIIISNTADPKLKKFLDPEDEMVQESFLFMSIFMEVFEINPPAAQAFLTEVLLLNKFIVRQLRESQDEELE
jgi:plasmid stability protein